MERLRRRTAVFIALALAGGLAGCGDDSKTEESSGGGAATTAAPPKGADAIDVVMQENFFTVGGDLKSGGTVRLSNAGKEFHMMGIGKFKDGKTFADLTAAIEAFSGPEEETSTTAGGPSTTAAAPSTTAAGPSTTAGEGEAEQGGGDPFAGLFDDVGVPGGIMGPGLKADVTVPGFGEGSYALICFLPTEGGGPPHFVQGMVAGLTVVADKSPEPTADATFKVETGKPVTGPATLAAGRHVLKFDAAAGSDKLEPGIAKLDPGKTVADINEAFASFETPDDFVLPVNAAAQIPGQVIMGLFDLGPNRTVYLGVDLTPGTYGLFAADTDGDDVPLDPVEKGTLTVT